MRKRKQVGPADFFRKCIIFRLERESEFLSREGSVWAIFELAKWFVEVFGVGKSYEEKESLFIYFKQMGKFSQTDN